MWWFYSKDEEDNSEMNIFDDYGNHLTKEIKKSLSIEKSDLFKLAVCLKLNK